jgi:hypothetical protein
MEGICNWFKERLIDPLKRLPLAAKSTAIASGLIFGLFPVPGFSTFLLLFALKALDLRGIPFTAPQSTIALSVNLISTPAMLAMIPVWLDLGSYFLDLQNCTASDILDGFHKSIVGALSDFTTCIIAASLAWLIVSGLLLSPFFMMHKRWVEQVPDAAGRVLLTRSNTGENLPSSPAL